MARFSKVIAGLVHTRKPNWDVYTASGVMFRQCLRTHRIQYRDCKTHRWIEVESANQLADLIKDSREIWPESPAWAWAQNLEIESTEILSATSSASAEGATAIFPSAPQEGKTRTHTDYDPE